MFERGNEAMRKTSAWRQASPRVERLEDRLVRNSAPLETGSATIPALHSNPYAHHAVWLDFDGLDSDEADDWGWTGPADVTADTVALLQVLGRLPGGLLGSI